MSPKAKVVVAREDLDAEEIEIEETLADVETALSIAEDGTDLEAEEVEEQS